MTDIFFSYRSVDRERVRPIHDAFAKQGFEVFWDQEVPSGVDWDTWIRQHLSKSKCAVVFWSVASVESDNVRHEATVAKRQGKLITVLLEALTPDQFPMGLYSQQAINLADWKGDFDHAEWNKLARDIELKLTPPWMQRKIYELEAELVAERARREGVENRDKILQAQIAKEVAAQAGLKREREEAVDKVVELEEAVEALKLERAEIERHAKQLSDELDTARTSLTANASSDANGLASAVRRESTSYVQIVRAVVIAAAVAVGYWSHAFISRQTSMTPSGSPASSPQSRESASKDFNPASLSTKESKRDSSFTRKMNSEAYGETGSASLVSGQSIDECEQSCRRSLNCNTYTYRKFSKSCFLYPTAQFRPNAMFDSGVRD